MKDLFITPYPIIENHTTIIFPKYPLTKEITRAYNHRLYMSMINIAHSI